MAALDFPAAPDVNDTHTQNGRTWTWNGESWRATSAGEVTDTPIQFGALYTGSWHVLFDAVPFAGVGPATAAWPSASRAIFLPLEIQESITVAYAGVNNGGTVSGNFDVGIYSFAGSLLVSSGSTAQAGTSDVQNVNLADTLLTPGVYYLALVLDNTTGTVIRWNSLSTQWLTVAGVQEMASAFPLPSTATFANPSSAYLPSLTLIPGTVI